MVELGHDLPSQHPYRPVLQVGESAGAIIEDAQRADRKAFRGLEESAGVKSYMRRGGHQLIAVEARIQSGIRNHEELLFEQDVRAERGSKRRAVYAEPHFRLEELPSAGDEVDHRDGRLASLGQQIDDLVESGLARRIHDFVSRQSGNTCSFKLDGLCHLAGEHLLWNVGTASD